MVIWSKHLFAMEMFIVPITGRTFWNPQKAIPKRVKEWSLRTLSVKLIEIGAKVITYSRYVIFQMAEVLVSKRLFQEILKRIHRLKPVPIGYG